MNQSKRDQVETLDELWGLMERSTRFISLSGLIGVFSGVYALLGAGAAYWQLKLNVYSPENYAYLKSSETAITKFLLFFFIDAGLVSGLTILTAVYFTLNLTPVIVYQLRGRTAFQEHLNTLEVLIKSQIQKP